MQLCMNDVVYMLCMYNVWMYECKNVQLIRLYNYMTGELDETRDGQMNWEVD